MLDLFFSAFITLFVVIDPPGCAPIYASLTHGASAAQRRGMAIRAVLVAGIILVIFALFGEQLLGALHIELDSFRIAGGIMLFVIAIDMVFEKRTQRREERAEKVAASPEVEDVSVFPMAMPMIAGPGSIASAMLYMQNAGSDPVGIGIVSFAISANLVLAGLIFLAAGPLLKVMGDQIAGASTRIFGVILSALAVQMIIVGVIGAFGLTGAEAMGHAALMR